MQKNDYKIEESSGKYINMTLPSLVSWGIMFLILALTTMVGFLFQSLNFTEANIITVYLLGELLIALFTKNYICSGVSSLTSVILFNFFFTEPRLSLLAYESGYPVTFAIMLTASLITGTLANKLAANAKRSADVAYHTQIMLDTSQLLQQAGSDRAMITIMAEQLKKLLRRNIVVYSIFDETLNHGQIFPIVENDECKSMLTPQEQTVVRWVWTNKERAGAGTERMKDALCMYIPVKTNECLFCIVGIQVGANLLETSENSILTSILGECALAIENIRNVKEKEEIALLAKNEQLRANLLRSISHDLRTPLTSISGNAENLLSNYEQIDEVTRKQILMDVYDDSQWLITLVENLLSITRISEGRMNLNISSQLMEEVIHEALRHVNRKAEEHHISVEVEEELLLAQMDARLISQVIINLVDNAVKYTQKGSDIIISAKNKGKYISVSVSDNGPGISDNSKQKVFQMFYIGENIIADCRRSLGLGLALCQSIINAHGGEIMIEDNKPQGCIFTFTIPISEVNLNE